MSYASPQVQEVVEAAVAAGEARIERRGDVVWYVDPLFGPDVPLSSLRYDPELGLYVQEDHEID
ncbi:hypothetical protein [Deinococcus aquaedulcis]|uniref:hypothetical protein n=1 Tax=Deinococcus aquaedulcis TaxID=2840455 RepID=UPI001C835DF8|nr:hypothetical protein [Deinococcus aquaedulcis]